MRLKNIRASRSLAAIIFLLTLAGCAGLDTKREPEGASALLKPSAAGANAQTDPLLRDSTPPANDLSDSGADLLGMPLEVNRMVLQWIDYFQGQGRPHMERYLSRSKKYMPLMKAILKKEGLPEDLIYIALIESGFSATAHSHANAVGYWQFIRGTGKNYGLRIDSFVDERRDFVKSTKAAADYFKGLYNLFGAWYLAVASYNVGENRVKGLIMKYRTRDFWQLARENKLPQETVHYVPKFLAARLIAKEPEKYGFGDVEYMAPLDFVEVEFTTNIDLRKLAKEMGLEHEEIRDLNPAYKKGIAFEKNGKLLLRVPRGTEAKALAAAGAAAAGSKKSYAALADEDYGYYRVKSGDTVASIARRFNTSQRQIRRLNNLGSSSRLAAGRRIRVPGEPIAGLAKAEKASATTDNGKKNPSEALRTPQGRLQSLKRAQLRNPERQAARVHIVRKGDTLIEIARKYQVPLRTLAQHNQIKRQSKVPIGARIEIP